MKVKIYDIDDTTPVKHGTIGEFVNFYEDYDGTGIYEVSLNSLKDNKYFYEDKVKFISELELRIDSVLDESV